ncbi:unnamed protein product [Moneuplotes crassus]|uniref:C2H2-type domain-containing protein n=1 Tax=Euplotes crassus TaxID=5936 RepID=A0AAD2D734_EUPCR|nr:unnamed protein product [Moneuplotes crassus]
MLNLFGILKPDQTQIPVGLPISLNAQILQQRYSSSIPKPVHPIHVLENLKRQYCMCSGAVSCHPMKPQSTPLNNDCGALEDLPPKDIKESDKKMEKKSSPLSDFSDIKQTSVKDFEHITYDKEDSKGTVVTIFVCKFQDCEKTFTRSWNFLDHARTHLGIKPYSCPHCPRSFTQKGNLKKHMKQHSEPTLENRKKFVCTHCSSRYTEKYNLKVHIKKYHPEKASKI